MIDAPQSGDNEDQAKSDLDKIGAVPQTSDTTPANKKEGRPRQQRYYAQYVMRPLKAIWRRILITIDWINQKGPFVTAIATVAIALLTAFYVLYSRGQWQVMSGQLSVVQRQFRQAQEQEQWDLEPYVDLTKAVVLKSPISTDNPVVVLTLTNKGKSPAKNVRYEAFLELHAIGTRLKPSQKGCFPKWGSTYPSDSPQIVVKKTREAISPIQLAAYKSGDSRLYLYGRIVYQDLWRQDLPFGEGSSREYRSSIFCRSFGKDNEEFLRMNLRPDEAAIMTPCTAHEWPFDDHHESEETSYANCRQKDNNQ